MIVDAKDSEARTNREKEERGGTREKRGYDIEEPSVLD
jgi:hypothetical protein